MWDEVYQEIERATGAPFRGVQRQPVAGGTLNRTERLTADTQDFFIKYRRADSGADFAAEVSGLRELQATGTVRVPQPVCWGHTRSGVGFVVLEYLHLHSGASAAEQLGWQLAGMHRVARPYFGWPVHNTIGSTPQRNTPTDDWVAFWREERLRAQAALVAPRHGRLRDGLDRLDAHLADFFTSYRPRPALLHGDLWGGNYASDGAGQPVLFDPATYYGDREADLALTELFGGFPPQFYAAYREAYPLDPGYDTRRDLYNLYHVLNHLHLFGEGYLPQAERLVDRLLAAVR
ncbi:MAG TPA: fructosamine kinase family protein [Acidiferrobacteraceae bacterium]|nr:fructosamine kinase family protein [Acidiferrobacteraceae bacterium]